MTHSISRVCGRFAGVALSAVFLLATPVAFSADKAKGPEISRGIAKEMEAAQKALKASQWQEALKNLDAAEAKGNLTPFDKKTIYDFKGFANIKLQRLKEAETAYETAMATGQYSPEDASRTQKMLFQLAAGNGQFSKAEEYGKKLNDSGQFGTNDYVIMEQLYYQDNKNCKEATVWADKAAAAARKAGETPKELIFQIKLQCAGDNGDNATVMASLIDLIKLTNKTQYWNNLLRYQMNEKLNDHDLLMVLRVMYDTKSMTDDGPYSEMAQLLNDGALPGEALMVINAAQTAGVVKDDHKDRMTRLAKSLEPRAESDKKSLPQQEAEAAKSKSGQAYVKLGEVYYGAGDYQNAVTAINKGIQAGGIKNQDEAYVYLGRAQVQLKNNAEAKKAFASLKTAQGVNPSVLKLWDLYAEKLGT